MGIFDDMWPFNGEKPDLYDIAFGIYGEFEEDDEPMTRKGRFGRKHTTGNADDDLDRSADWLPFDDKET